MNWWRLRSRVHSAWLVAAFAAGVCIGVVASRYLPAGFGSATMWFVVAMILAGLCVGVRWVAVVPLMIGAGVILGLWRGSVTMNGLRPYAALQGHVVTVAGAVRDDVDKDARGSMVVALGEVIVDGHHLPGAVRLTLGGEADIRRGDRIAVRGLFQTGFGAYAGVIYRGSLQNLERPVPGDVARQIRDGFADRVRSVIDEPMVSLGLGYLLGQRRGLPEELSQALVVAGLTHVVVASGYNLTVLVRLMRRLFARFSKYLAFATSGAMILGFIAITGMSPSMSRAGLVAGLSLLAWYYGRTFHPFVLLPVAAAVTLLANPTYGYGDIGWQLSFAAFAGVMIVAPLLQRYFFGEAPPGIVRQIAGETIAAFIVTWPILAASFGKISTVAIIANMLVVPLVPLAMLLVFVAGVVTIVPPLAVMVGAVASWLLGYMVWAAQTVASWPWAQATVQLPVWGAVLCYVAIVLFGGYLWWATRLPLEAVSVVE